MFNKISKCLAASASEMPAEKTLFCRSSGSSWKGYCGFKEEFLTEPSGVKSTYVDRFNNVCFSRSPLLSSVHRQYEYWCVDVGDRSLLSVSGDGQKELRRYQMFHPHNENIWRCGITFVSRTSCRYINFSSVSRRGSSMQVILLTEIILYHENLPSERNGPPNPSFNPKSDLFWSWIVVKSPNWGNYDYCWMLDLPFMNSIDTINQRRKLFIN